MLKNNKAPRAELLKKEGEPIANYMWELIKTIWKQEQILKKWKVSVIYLSHV